MLVIKITNTVLYTIICYSYFVCDLYNLLELTCLSTPSYSCVFVKESHERKIPAKVPEKKKAPPPKGM